MKHKDSFDVVIEQVPNEQRRLLERMMEMKLVDSFVWEDKNGKWAIAYTREGRDFLALVQRLVSPDSQYRQASLLALDMLADGKAVIGGYARE